MLTNIESGRTKVTDEQIVGLQRAFGVRIILLFPKAVQELDDKYARRESDGPLKTPRHRKATTGH